MISTQPIESAGELVERFPGIEESDPTALGRFAFFAAVHTPPEEIVRSVSSEERQDWHQDVERVFSEVYGWQNSGEEQISRADFARQITKDFAKEQDEEAIFQALHGLSPDDGYHMVCEFLGKWGYRGKEELAPSPLFPEGRTIYREIDSFKDEETGKFFFPYGTELVDEDDVSLDSDIKGYVNTEYPAAKRKESLDTVLENVTEIDPQELAKLRDRFGSKVAYLISFKNAVDEIDKALPEMLGAEIEIPPFVAVPVGIYKLWREKSESFSSVCEELRGSSVELLDKSSSTLVVVRSSAVKSEDGTEHSGAGVYKSIAVDPNDPEAFQRAIEEVYKSATSDDAQTYQREIGVTDEKMGLVIQRYEEEGRHRRGILSRGDSSFGYANSRGANSNLIEIHTNVGMLLYDKHKVEENLLVVEGSSREERRSLLHTVPDHETDLGKATDLTGRIPHAVVLAGKVFGGQVQVEFFNDSVLQIRPLIAEFPDIEISFPENLEPASEVAGVGMGDMELKRLDVTEDNSDRKGFIVFNNEYMFTEARGHAGYRAFPTEGAVVILSPSASGHIQAHCSEKGLMCFYPKKDSEDFSLEDLVDVNYGEDLKLRFISDGYEGKVYKIPEV